MKMIEPIQLENDQVSSSTQVLCDRIKHGMCQSAGFAELEMPKRIITQPFFTEHLFEIMAADVAENAVAQCKLAAFEPFKDDLKHILPCKFG